MTDIKRRDFLNGIALTIAAGLTPAAQAAAQSRRYPPALTGLRGDHPGSFETSRRLESNPRAFAADRLTAEESYDLVVVGAGISGLSAAWFYRQLYPRARILVLDNHDDFGGHAKRNEFMLGSTLRIGYGGSQSMENPNKKWSETSKKLLRDLGVDITRFKTAFDGSLYSSLGLTRGLFFGRETFGRDAILSGDPLTRAGDVRAKRASDIRPLEDFVSDMPISEAGKKQLLALYHPDRDPLAGKSTKEKWNILERTSYRDLITKIWGCREEVANCFQGRTLDYYGLGCDAVAASELEDWGYPGFEGLRLEDDEEEAETSTRGSGGGYIYHFPDGNASLARLLVRALIPATAPGETMDDVVLAPFDYGELDRKESNTRIRLDSTCVRVRNAGGKVEIDYVRAGTPHRIDARSAVLACYNMSIPSIMPELPSVQKAALSMNVKSPIVYTNVLVRDWRPWVNLKMRSIAAPMSFHTQVMLDFPVSLGGYHHPRDPAEPMLLHLAHVPHEPNRGLDARSQFRIGAEKLMQMTFADFEDRIRDELDRMLGPGGFSSQRDIAAITVNRWPQGYAYEENSLFDPDDYEETVVARARQPFGRVAIANSDASGEAYAQAAIDQAERAVRELASRSGKRG